ncbi:hypothetical protein DFH09DRAFT_1410251 [Mycena vulgaris]|nr:hypothetical protein DFH09DRAFT_1410251 [Mycena vulgaris]
MARRAAVARRQFSAERLSLAQIAVAFITVQLSAATFSEPSAKMSGHKRRRTMLRLHHVCETRYCIGIESRSCIGVDAKELTRFDLDVAPVEIGFQVTCRPEIKINRADTPIIGDGVCPNHS